MKIAIAGAGLMGQLIAYYLSQHTEYEVTLYDRNLTQSAAKCAAGMIAPFTELEKSQSIVTEIGLKSLNLWPDIIKTINPDIYFQQRGSIVMAHQQDTAELETYLAKINSHWSDPPYRHLNKEELLEPDLISHNDQYYFADEGQIDSQSFMLSLQKYLIDAQVKIADNVNVVDVKSKCIQTESQSLQYDFVFDCRGTGALSNFEDLRAVRGELVWLKADQVNLTRPIRLLHPRYSIYITPRPDNIYIVGASEIEADDKSPISLRSMMELLTAAYSVHKGFIEARIIHTQTNCRPTLKDGLPKIKYAKKMLAINGLYRHGYLLAPALAKAAINYLKTSSVGCYPTIWEECYDKHRI